MKLIKPAFEIIEQQAGLEGIYKMIELAGRTCYKSEDRITENSAKEFVDRLIKSGHTSVLEHGSIYLYIETDTEPSLMVKEIINFYKYNKYSHVNTKYILDKDQDSHTPLIIGYKYYISTNLRVCIENDRKEFLNPSLLCEPTEYHEKRVCVRYTSDIHFYKDCTRHRVFSWAIESTRFCNYIKQKFGSSISFATPIWLKDEEQKEFKEDLKTIESIYFKWINKGWQPQQAAYFLIQGTKAEVIMTGFVSDYKHFFDLRSEISKTGQPHPTVLELVEPLRQEFIKRGYITE